MTETTREQGLRAQITGPDCGGDDHLVGMIGTIIEHNPLTDSYMIAYYRADLRMAFQCPVPSSSIELIDIN